MSLNPEETPKISVVTPSFNQGEFIERTIKSLIDQNYPNLEYIIIDGGSTDETCDIIKKYSAYINYWVSEKDSGQTHAINKGLSKITGDYWAILCSDDTYEPGTLHKIAKIFKEKNSIDVIYGNCNFINSDDLITRRKYPGEFNREKLLKNNYLYQPSIFLKSWILKEFGFLDEKLNYAMDYEYWIRISKSAKFFYANLFFSNYRLHTNSKSMFAINGMAKECKLVKIKNGYGNKAYFDYYQFLFLGRFYYLFKRYLFDKIAKFINK